MTCRLRRILAPLCAWLPLRAGLRAALLCALAAGLLLSPEPAAARVDVETLATRIADSLKEHLSEPAYETVAISRIRGAESAGYDAAQLIDFTNVKIVRGRRLRVVDRSKLELILKEQQIQLSDFVSAEKYQQLGQLTGVDLFIYGTFYGDALVLKGIDVQNSAIAWADVFATEEGTRQAQRLQALGQRVVSSLEQDLNRLRQAEISLVSFWNVETDGSLPPDAVMDYISVAITRHGGLRVVDRENLELITEEQRLNQAVFIDQSSAKRLGQLYGVDAFLYGSVTQSSDGTHIASLKMMNIFNGVIEWADLVRLNGAEGAQEAALGGRGSGPAGMVRISPGIFLMGTNAGPRNATPLHQVELDAYFIDETEVPNAAYAEFVKARDYRTPVGWPGQDPPPGKGNLPVVGISWEDAFQYCRFQGKRLPSEAEWEKAARGTSGQTYPWLGDNFTPEFTVTRESGRKTAVPVQQAGRDVSPYGVKHMAGNVREWVQDVYKAYPGSGARDPAFGRERVVRGGSWATDQTAARTYFRGASNPNLAWQDVGFRCARDD